VTDRSRCQVVLAHLHAYLDGEADVAQRAQIDGHLEECRACSSRAGFEKALKARLARLGEATAPAALRRRLRRLIDAF
jgi:anti-sigma factor (TIGR02949 family)